MIYGTDDKVVQVLRRRLSVLNALEAIAVEFPKARVRNAPVSDLQGDCSTFMELVKVLVELRRRKVVNVVITPNTYHPWQSDAKIEQLSLANLRRCIRETQAEIEKRIAPTQPTAAKTSPPPAKPPQKLKFHRRHPHLYLVLIGAGGIILASVLIDLVRPLRNLVFHH